MKKIYDAVHGFIKFNEIEQQLIDSEPFQREHSIHQLGIAFLVYPGATHTRFEHSLGTMEIATKIFDSLLEKYQKAHEIEQEYWRQVIRLAALCHDLGHLPFSHDAEKALLGPGGHEEWTLKAIQSPSLRAVFEKVAQAFPGKEVERDVIKMAIGEEHLLQMGISFPFSPLEKIFSQVITGDFFGADRIDYLLRDAQCTGVSYGLFDYQQLIEMLCILETPEGEVLGIEENGIASCEALLLARHFMHQRVYQHPSVKAYKLHLSCFMYDFYEQGRFLESLEKYLSVTDHEILAAARKSQHNRHADALFKRSSRFSVLELSKEVVQEKVLSLQKELKIPEESLFFREKKEKPPQGFTFPVQLRSGSVIPAHLCSQIQIPFTLRNFLYVEESYEDKIKERLLCL